MKTTNHTLFKSHVILPRDSGWDNIREPQWNLVATKKEPSDKC